MYFLVDFAEFNVSKYLPKNPTNSRARQIAADLIREGRSYGRLLNNNRTYNGKKVKGKIMPTLTDMYAMSPSVLVKNGYTPPSLKTSDLPNVEGLTKSYKFTDYKLRDKTVKFPLAEKRKLENLADLQKNAIGGGVPEYVEKGGKLPLRKYKISPVEEMDMVTKVDYAGREGSYLSKKPKKQIEKELEDNRLKSLVNEMWGDKDYRKAMNAIYKNDMRKNLPRKGTKLSQLTGSTSFYN